VSLPASPAVSTFTPKQAARRARVIQAALDLATEGGYDSVQMRDVSTRADVALGTIYRYFSSKDHLLVSAMGDWTGQLRERLQQRPAQGDTEADRVVDVLRRACRSLERQPLLAAALVKAMSSDDAGVAQASADVGRHVRGMISPLLVDLDPDTREAVISVIGHVWSSSLIGWSNGRYDIGDVADELDQATRLLLRPPY
jgi:AcrR family transcriptional regulator